MSFLTPFRMFAAGRVRQQAFPAACTSALVTGDTHRTYFAGVIFREIDTATGTRKWQSDPVDLARGFHLPRRSDGRLLVSKPLTVTRHEKPFHRRNRLHRNKVYNSRKKTVMDLARYIEYRQEFWKEYEPEFRIEK